MHSFKPIPAWYVPDLVSTCPLLQAAEPLGQDNTHVMRRPHTTVRMSTVGQNCSCWLDVQDTAKNTVALRCFNDALLHDGRVSVSVIPVGDGMALCRRKL